LRRAILNSDVLTLDVAEVTQPSPKVIPHRYIVDDADRRNLRQALLRARHERPRHRRAAEQRDERTAFHSITSSASASNAGGTSRPSTFAVVRLITNSNLVDCITGRSPGFSPFRIRPA